MSRRIALAFAAGLCLVAPVAAAAAPVLPMGPEHVAPVTPAQDWWEREGHADELRERYWRLPPPERARYDQLQDEINHLEWRREHDGDRYEARRMFEHIEQLRHEQRRILRWGEGDRR